MHANHTMTTTTLVILALVLLLAAGIALLTLGLRGKRINTNPHCRRCGYDVSAAGDAPGGAPAVCPECGRDLTLRRALRIGARRRRRGMIVTGGVLLLVALAIGGAATWGAATKFNWNTVKPVWMLMREARSGDPKREPGAVVELVRRATNGRLSRGALVDAAALGLAVQASPAHPWLTGYGDLVEAGAKAGVVTPDQLAAFVRASFDFGASGRSNIRAGDPFPLEVMLRAARAGSGAVFPISAYIAVAGATLDGRPIDAAKAPGSGGMYTLGDRGASILSRGLPLDAGAGPHTLAITYRFRAHPSRLPGGTRLAAPAPAEAPLCEWTTVKTIDFQTLPSDADTVRAVPDDAALARVRSAVRIDGVSIAPRAGTPYFDVSLMIGPVPVEVAFAVELRQGDRRWPVGSIVVRANGGSTGASMGCPTDGFDGERIDIALRASADAARTNTRVTSYLDGEIVIPNVRVKRSTPTAPAPTPRPLPPAPSEP